MNTPTLLPAPEKRPMSMNKPLAYGEVSSDGIAGGEATRTP